MSRWLLKTEPTEFSFDDLEKDGMAVWDGISNNLALMHLRAMKKGDELLVYHSGSEKAVVGTARVSRSAYPDPKKEDPKMVVIEIQPGKKLTHPVRLTEIRKRKEFESFDLVRISRLSVIPVPDKIWHTLLKMGNQHA